MLADMTDVEPYIVLFLIVKIVDISGFVGSKNLVSRMDLCPIVH